MPIANRLANELVFGLIDAVVFTIVSPKLRSPAPSLPAELVMETAGSIETDIVALSLAEVCASAG